MRRLAGLAAIGAMAVLALSGVPSAALAATPTGTLVIQTTNPAGQKIALANANVDLVEADGTPVRAGSTDSTGHLTIPNVPAGSGYKATIGERIGAPRLSGETDGISVTAGDTVDVNLPMPLGGSISGVLTSPLGDIEGTALEALNLTTGQNYQQFVGADNRFLQQGLTAGVYRFSSYSGGPTEPTQWVEDITQETSTHQATFDSHDNHFVHSDYDLEMTLEPGQGAPPSWDGATVRVTNDATGAVFTEKADSSSLPSKLTQYETPSGSYTIEILPVVGLGQATQAYWYAGPGAAFTTSATDAVPVAVAFGGLVQLSGH
jgi:hypothetical protein